MALRPPLVDQFAQPLVGGHHLAHLLHLFGANEAGAALALPGFVDGVGVGNLAKSRRRFGPQWAKTFLATLDEEADLSGALKSDFSRGTAKASLTRAPVL
jgi:hypothetical protein